MSIPPLVCSTPPPPDQCEDDKDPEDFDIHYNLSQEDEYDYGSFSNYNHFQSAISVNKPLSDSVVNSIDTKNAAHIHNDSSDTITKNTTNSETLQWPNTNVETNLDVQAQDQKQEIEVKLNNDLEINTESNINHELLLNTDDKVSKEEGLHIDKKANNEEELNIEDLNLTIEEESLSSIEKNELYDNNADSDKSDSSGKEKSQNIPNITTGINSNDANETSPVDEITVTPPSIDDVDDHSNTIDDLKMDDEPDDLYNDSKNELEPDFPDDPEIIQASKTFKEVLNDVNNDTDDEFGDFNDFHSTSDNKGSTIVDTCENPWETNQSDADFGTFEAHFDNTENSESQLFQNFKSETEKTAPDRQLAHNSNVNDDDFGDFDDFKSSVQETKNNEEIQDPLSQVPVLDFQKPESESQILENINKILNSIFEEDVPEPESVFDVKLEALLCETWGHLLETDVRQPYIVNWNSSIGQNTLLKALCIDSRNILFGPKWSYNMPKYAANLSVAPLQPQKQTTPSGPNQPEVSSDKNSSKVPGAWSDPFTSDGQESCNKEGNAAMQKRPTDLNVFDTALSTKSDKIYSCTIDVQPIRQINLPDTHIFTPTDSETPRSKTIHYNGPTVFLSQSSIDSDKKPSEVATSEIPADSTILDDADYSDFQDFKGSFNADALEVKPAALSAEVVEPPASASQPSTSAAYSVGILQPIKIEPIMPTLNWPSPGEVKETFGEFTEFASSTSWNNEPQETRSPAIGGENTRQVNDTMNDNSIKSNPETASKINDSFDDEFDTFQSALPSNEPMQTQPVISNFSHFVATDFSQTLSAGGSPNQAPELDFVFSKIDPKTEPISLTKSYDILKTETFMHQRNAAISMPKVKESVAKVPAQQSAGPAPPNTVLQPTVSSLPPQQNSAQILQPLSLESFSQINWPNPGINLQDLSRFNPVETLNSLKSDLSVSGNSKGVSPLHASKGPVQSQPPEDDIWGEFVSSKPKPQQPQPKKAATFADDDEWTDFVSSPTVKPQNGLNTISLNVHTNLNIQKSSTQTKQSNQALEIPITHYITPKSTNHSSYNDRHFQNL